jgi:hypothetical protein
MRGLVPSCLLSLTLALAACGDTTPSNGLGYVPPAARGALAPIDLPGATTGESLAIVAARLRAAGFQGVTTDRGRSVVTAQSSDTALVECGTFVQTAKGNTTRFPANAPRSVLFSDEVPGGILTRDMRVQTDVRVTLDGAGSARISTAHEVRASQSPVIPGAAWRDRAVFDGDATGAVADRVVCTGSRSVERALAAR